MGAQFCQALRIQVKVVPRPAPLFFHQTSGLQYLQVLGYRGAAHGELPGQFAYGLGPAPQQVDNSLPRGVRQRAQHLGSVSHTLR